MILWDVPESTRPGSFHRMQRTHFRWSQFQIPKTRHQVYFTKWKRKQTAIKSLEIEIMLEIKSFLNLKLFRIKLWVRWTIFLGLKRIWGAKAKSIAIWPSWWKWISIISFNKIETKILWTTTLRKVCPGWNKLIKDGYKVPSLARIWFLV